jgi:translation elongation factor EF-4
VCIDSYITGAHFIARKIIDAFRQDVTGYPRRLVTCKKLFGRQIRGKKRFKYFGKVDIPSEAFAITPKRNQPAPAPIPTAKSYNL